MCDVFLSYSHTDSKIAEYFRSHLNSVGVRCFMAEKDVVIGQNFQVAIQENLKLSKIVLFLITPHSIDRAWVKTEAGAAWVLEKTIISARMFVKPSEMIDILQNYQSPNIEDRGSQDELIDKITEMVDFAAFWKLLINKKNPEEFTYALLSAKVGIEFEKGKPTQKTGHTVLVSFNEFLSMLNLHKELDPLRNKLKIAHGGVNVVDENGSRLIIPDFPRHANLIVIGSSHANVVCSEIMSSPKLYNPPFTFGIIEEGEETDKCIVSRDGRTFPSHLRSKAKIKSSDPLKLDEDYGIILRVTNPFKGGDDNKVLILAGNHGLGTEAAIKFVANRDLIRFLRKHAEDDDFEALFDVDLLKGQVKNSDEHSFRAEFERDKRLDFQIQEIFKLKSGKWTLSYSSR